MSNVPQDCGPNDAAYMAQRVESQYEKYLAGGPDAAYKFLKNAYDSADPCSRDAYFKQVTDDLQASGHLPNMAVGWLKAEKDHISGGSGVINKQDILRAEENGGLDRIFGQVLLTNVPSPGDNKTFFDQVAHTKKHWTEDPDGIENADLRKYGRQEHRAERHADAEQRVAENAAPLFANNCELLNALDTGSHGERNGFISRHEMNRFLDRYKENPGVGVYTDDNARYVQALKEGRVPGVNDVPMHGFSVARVERAGGLDENGNPLNPTKPEFAINGDTKPQAAVDKNCDVPQPPKDVAPSKPAETSTACSELAVRNEVESRAVVKTGQGYDAVAANLLGIEKGHHRTAQEVQEIVKLGLELKEIHTYDTHNLRAGNGLLVGADIDHLVAKDPVFAAAVQKIRDGLTAKPATDTTKDTDNQTNQDSAFCVNDE
jgi:hypothetical protein